MIRVMLFGANRHGARAALQYLISQKINVVGCVFEDALPNALGDICANNQIPCYNNIQVYEAIENGELPEFDLGISFLFRKIIKQQVIDRAGQAFINFHPAPVEVHRGVAACCYCLLHDFDEWGVTAHHVTSKIDEGDIIDEIMFPLENVVTSLEAESLIQEYLIVLFKRVVDAFVAGSGLPFQRKQDLSQGEYFSHKDLEKAKRITADMSAERMIKTIHAMWFPPYCGAYVEKDGEKFTLVDDYILQQLAKE